VEIRTASLEVRGRSISGIAVPWGARARVLVRGEVVQETFVRDSFRDLQPVPLVIEHGGPSIGRVTPRNTARGLEVAGDYSGDLGGRDRFSIEFEARGETRSGDLRIVHDALLGGLAAVRRPAYDDAVIERRQGLGSLSSFVPSGSRMDCDCPEGDCEEIEIEEGGFEGVPDQVIAIAGRFDQAIGNAALTPSRRGLDIDIDLLDTTAAHDVAALVVGGVAVYARPLINVDASVTREGRNRGNVLIFERAVIDGVLVKPVIPNRARGLDPVRLEREGRNGGLRGREGRESAPETILRPSRRRLWL